MDTFFSWLFGTRQGVMALNIGSVIAFALIAFLLERGTRKQYYNHEPEDNDESGWSFFDDDNL